MSLAQNDFDLATTPAPAHNPPALPTDDNDTLNYTQKVRQMVVSDLITGGMPKDPKDRAQLLAALDGMDRQVLTKQKIKVDEKVADADRHAATILAQVLAQTHGRSPYERPVIEGEVITPALPGPTVDLSKLPEFEPVPGETDIGTADMNCETFMAKFDTPPPTKLEDQAAPEDEDD